MKEYSVFDAEKRFNISEIAIAESSDCIAGLVLQGGKPNECSVFGIHRTPENRLARQWFQTKDARRIIGIEEFLQKILF